MGLSAPRAFIEVSSLAGSDDPEAFSSGVEIDPEMRRWTRQKGLHQIAMGRVFSLQLPEGSIDYKVSACVDHLIIINGRSEVQADMGVQELQATPGAEDSCRGIIGNAVTAIEELLLINSDPTYFIFEKSPAKPRQSKTGRITRSPDRFRYIPLTVKISGGSTTFEHHRTIQNYCALSQPSA